MKANKKEGWVPAWRKKMPKGWEHPKPAYPSNMTNHERMQARALQRRAVHEAKRNAPRAEPKPVEMAAPDFARAARG